MGSGFWIQSLGFRVFSKMRWAGRCELKGFLKNWEVFEWEVLAPKSRLETFAFEWEVLAFQGLGSRV